MQAGAEAPLGPHWGLFADVKKGFLKTRATGTLAGAPVDSSLRLDPTVISAGAAYRF